MHVLPESWIKEPLWPHSLALDAAGLAVTLLGTVFAIWPPRCGVRFRLQQQGYEGLGRRVAKGALCGICGQDRSAAKTPCHDGRIQIL